MSSREQDNRINEAVEAGDRQRAEKAKLHHDTARMLEDVMATLEGWRKNPPADISAEASKLIGKISPTCEKYGVVQKVPPSPVFKFSS